MGWLPDAQFRVAPMAERPAVERFHDPAYVDALARAEANQAVSAEDRARFRIGAESNPVYPEIYRRPMTSAGGVMLACRADRGRRRRALPRRRHPSWPPGAGQRLLLPQRPGAGDHDLARSRARERGLSRYRRASRRWRAGRVPQRRPGADDQRARGRALAVHRPRGRPGRRRRTEPARAAGAERYRDALADAGGGAAADRRPAAGRDLSAMRGRRAGRGSARQAVAVQQRALGGGGGAAPPGAAAGGDGRGRL